MAFGELPLSRSTLDRNAVARSDAQFLQQMFADAATRVLPVRGGKVPIVAGATAPELVFLSAEQVATWNTAHGLAEPLQVYLGHDAALAAHVVAAELAVAEPSDNAPVSADIADAATLAAVADLVPAAASWVALREVSTQISASDAGIAVASVAMFNWHRTMNFCHHCGAKTVVAQAGWVRKCSREGRELFPRTDSAVIMSVVDGQGRLLLAQNAAAPDPQRVSVLAGFVEPGEPLEASVRREVLEEVGVAVGDVKYLGSQPWPFPLSLMVGFEARFEGDGREQSLTLQADEIAWAEWFSREELVAAIEAGRVWLPSKSSIARAIINHWYGDDSLTSPVDA